MNIRTSTRLVTLAATMIAVVAIAPAAQAASHGTFVLRRSAPTGIDPHGTQARYNAQRVIYPGGFPIGVVKSTGAPSVPDRVDGLGSVRGPQIVPTPGRAASDSSSSFNWSYAATGAGLLLAAALLAMFTVSAAGRRRGGGIPQS
jgi:hypothetical protein